MARLLLGRGVRFFVFFWKWLGLIIIQFFFFFKGEICFCYYVEGFCFLKDWLLEVVFVGLERLDLLEVSNKNPVQLLRSTIVEHLLYEDLVFHHRHRRCV